MRRFILGLVCGVALGVAGTAVAASVVGGSGYLLGWDVTSNDGETICGDPYVWTATREIECD